MHPKYVAFSVARKLYAPQFQVNKVPYKDVSQNRFVDRHINVKSKKTRITEAEVLQRELTLLPSDRVALAHESVSNRFLIYTFSRQWSNSFICI